MTSEGKVMLRVGAALLVVVVAVAVFLFLREVSRPGEATARFIPDSAAVYVSINLRPGMSQLRLARGVMDRLQTDDFIRLRDDWLDELEDYTGVHLLDDVTPWIGADVSLALLNADPDEPEWVLMAQIGDRAAAADFMDDLVRFLEDELQTELDSYDRRGVTLWVADDDGLALGLTDEYLFIADSEHTIEDMVDNMESPPSRPLAESRAFIEARESLPAERVMFTFMQAGG